MNENNKNSLEEKVNLLAEKIENEQNPFKRMLYVIRARMVEAYLDRQISIQEIKDKAKKDREDKKSEKSSERDEAQVRLIILKRDLDGLRKKLAESDRVFDADSDEFLFGQSELKRAGGADELAKELEDSGNPDKVAAAKQIKNIEEIKREIERKEKERLDKIDELEKLNNNENANERRLKFAETKALTVQRGKNIGKWFKDTFGILINAIKERREENKIIKAKKRYDKMQAKLKNMETEFVNKYNMELETVSGDLLKEKAQEQAKAFRTSLEARGISFENRPKEQQTEFEERTSEQEIEQEDKDIDDWRARENQETEDGEKKIKGFSHQKKEYKGKKNLRTKIAAIVAAGAVALGGVVAIGHLNSQDMGQPISPITISQENKNKETSEFYTPDFNSRYVSHDENTLTTGNSDKQYKVMQRSNIEFTEDSQGRGKTGIVREDMLVEIYNRAIVKENSDGTRSIMLSSGSKTWEEFAKENNMKVEDIEKMLKESGVKEMVAIQKPGEHIINNVYGWVEASDLYERANEIEHSNSNTSVNQKQIISYEER